MNTFNSLPTCLTLEDVKSSFDAWRESRLKREPIPEALWEQLYHLTKSYKAPAIARALGLNTQDMQAGLKKRFSLAASDKPLTFVEVSLKEEGEGDLRPQAPSVGEKVSFLTILRPNGTRVLLHLYPQDLGVVIDHLMG